MGHLGRPGLSCKNVSSALILDLFDWYSDMGSNMASVHQRTKCPCRSKSSWSNHRLESKNDIDGSIINQQKLIWVPKDLQDMVGKMCQQVQELKATVGELGMLCSNSKSFHPCNNNQMNGFNPVRIKALGLCCVVISLQKCSSNTYTSNVSFM